MLKDSTSPLNRYKLALVCLKLHKFAEAEKALLLKPLSEGPEDPQVACEAPGYYLLGLICERQARCGCSVPVVGRRTR